MLVPDKSLVFRIKKEIFIFGEMDKCYYISSRNSSLRFNPVEVILGPARKRRT